MIAIANLLTALWLGLWAAYAVLALSRGHRHSALAVFIVHFLFCGVPLACDVLIGRPDYLNHPGFRDASRDTLTSLVYCLYAAICPVIWWLTALSRKPVVSVLPHQERPTFTSIAVQLFNYALLLAPILAVFASPNPGLYLQYAWVAVEEDRVSDAILNFHIIISVLCKASVFAGAFLLLWQRRPRWLLILACLFLTAWIDGKRNIVLFEVLIVCYTLWKRGFVGSAHVWKLGCVAALVIAGFSYFYQTTFRSNIISTYGWYENIRIDYGRDDVMKLAIYCELHPEEGTILDYRGQSMLFHLGTLVPRRVWDKKPEPYAVYVTARMLEMPARRLAWGMTTSILEEAIANFSWLGMLLGPLAISVVCRVGDRCRNSFVHLLTLTISCLLLAVQLTAIYPIFLMWIGLCLWEQLFPIPMPQEFIDGSTTDESFDEDAGAEQPVLPS